MVPCTTQTLSVRSRWALPGSEWFVYVNDDDGQDPNAKLALDKWKWLPVLQQPRDENDKVELGRAGDLLRTFAYDIVGNETKLSARHATVKKIFELQKRYRSLSATNTEKWASQNRIIAQRLKCSGEHGFKREPGLPQPPIVYESGLKVSATNPLTARFQREHFKKRQNAGGVSVQTQNSTSKSTPPICRGSATAQHIFLSHAGKDSGPFAAHLSEKLKSEGYETFFDADSILPGNQWQDDIEKNARECDLFVCLYSEHYGQRRWCMKELDLAIKTNRCILPVFLNGAEPPKLLSNFVSAVRAGAWSNMSEMGEDELQYYHTTLIHLSKIQAIRGFAMHPGNPKTAEVELSKKIKESIERLLILGSK